MNTFLSSTVFSHSSPALSDILIVFLLSIVVIIILISNYNRKISRNRFEKQAHYQKILWDLAKQDFIGLDSAFQEITRTVAEILNIGRVSIWRYNPDRSAIVCQEVYCLREKSLRKGLSIHISHESSFVKTLENEKTVIVDDTSRDPRIQSLHDPFFSNQEIKALIITLIWRNGQPDGILCITDTETKHNWSSEEINVAVGTADLITLVLESAERRQAEEALAVEANLLRALMDSSADSIYFKDRDSRFIRVNQGFFHMHDLDLDSDVTGKTDFDFHNEYSASILYKEEQEMMNQGNSLVTHIGHFQSKEGTQRWLSTIKVPMRNHSGAIIGLVGISRDITSSKTQELRLRQFLQAIEQSPATVVITDLQGDILYTNPKFSEITGYSSNDVLGKNPRILKSGETPPEEYEGMWKIISSGGEWSGEFHNRKKDGNLYWERTLISAVTDIDNQIIGYIAIKEDITNEKNLQEALMASQKLASIGNLAAGIAHEINNPMQTVIGMSDSLLNKINENALDPAQTKKYLETIRRNGWRVAEIVRSLLTYSRVPETSFLDADLNEIIRDSLLLIEHQLLSWSNISIVTDLSEELPPLFCDREKITQVLINLLTNARDAMPTGGKITISTHTDPERNTVNLVINDEGSGIPQTIIEKIYDPFFTTKPIGKGTGLGLSIVHGIVLSHKGKINVISQVNQGTLFTLTFPVNSPTSEKIGITN